MVQPACKRAAKRNYQVLSPLDFLAEFTQHIPAKGSHLIRCSAARAPPGGDGMEGAGRSDREPKELTYVDMDTFLSNF